MIRIEEAKPYHVGQIVRSMRKAHAEAVSALGINMHRDLRYVFNSSSYARSVFVDGKLAALWGISGTMTSSKAHVWLVFSEEAKGRPIEVMRHTMAELVAMLETRSELVTTIFDGDDEARRFAEIFGFRRMALPHKHGLTWMNLRRDVPLTKLGGKCAPFIIMGLPRSRTAWLSHFLTYGDAACLHDFMLEADGFYEMRQMLEIPNTGICETGFAMGWPALKKYFPRAKFVVVRRSVEEIRASLAAYRWEFAPGHLEWMSYRLEELSAQPGTLTVSFDALNHEETCKTIFEHCLNRPFDREWWLYWKDANIQIDMEERMSRILERGDAMKCLAQECDDLMSPVTLQIERWDDIKGNPIFREHRDEVGSFQELDYAPNFRRAAALDGMGKLVIATARAGRKLVGYLFFIVDEHPEDENTLLGIQNAFFVSKPFRGIGKGLHAMMRQELKERGVELLSMSAGVRGSGPKLAAFYKKLGAVEERQVFSLRI